MAGLVCAARARQLGLRPTVLEKGTRPGGSMLLSSCVVWRHREWEDFRAECPGGDEDLQRLVGKRFDPKALTALLADDVRLGTELPADAEPPLVLATGGFGKRLAAERGLLLRANPWS